MPQICMNCVLDSAGFLRTLAAEGVLFATCCCPLLTKPELLSGDRSAGGFPLFPDPSRIPRIASPTLAGLVRLKVLTVSPGSGGCFSARYTSPGCLSSFDEAVLASDASFSGGSACFVSAYTAGLLSTVCTGTESSHLQRICNA